MKPRTTTWHNLSCEKVFWTLKTDKKGISEKEAKLRLKKYGPNKLPEKKGATIIGLFISQFKSPLVYILAIAGIISFVVGERVDSAIIFAAVAINTLVGFFEEYRADKSLKALKKIVSYKAKVLRNGVQKEISAVEIVPGDIIILDAGDKIPADARLFEEHNFEVGEAALTGESSPVKKSLKALPENKILAERVNMVYAGTLAFRGRAKAIVVQTGKETEVGKIASMLREFKEEKTPLQESISRLARKLTYIIAVISLIIFALGIFEKKDFLEIFITTIAVAVAAIPEGLLISVTIILILGMKKILKDKAMVRKLVAAETLGSVSIICTDKTGTLTEGEMRVVGVHCCGKMTPLNEIASSKECSTCLEVLRAGLFCNDATFHLDKENGNQDIVGDPIEKALLLAGNETGLNKKDLNKKMPRVDEIPFDSAVKYMATLNKLDSGKNTVFVKGAPELILSLSKNQKVNGKTKELDQKERKNIEKGLDKLALQGYRVLGFGFREVDKKERFSGNDGLVKNLTFLGFVVFDDPLRPGTRESFNLAKQAGVRPVIVTGDHKFTAIKIANQLGLPTKEKNVLTAEDLENMSDDELRKRIKGIDVFARVEPRHKVRIVAAYQAKGEVVAMTGDGVNDAPALKAADIGVAVGYGTEVAKGAADMVLLDNNFKTIVRAVEQGRMIYENIKKVVLYLLSDSFSEIILILGSLVFFLPLPILPAQILWVNLIEDTLPNIALAFDPGEKEVMNEKPRKRGVSILDKEMKTLIFIIGIFTDIILFGMFYYFWKTSGNLEYTRSIVFAGLAVNSLFYVWACRSFRFTIWHKNPFANKFLIFSTIFGFLMLFIALYVPFFQNVLRTVPLGVFEWSVLVVFGILNIFLIEIVKYVFILRRKKIK
ncbi:MAG: HAD-IC family P-type ATPase [Patescibacteria group bacterium]|nr:HAD-IC family P-type ATPase [Patescibacteria group bacterium]